MNQTIKTIALSVAFLSGASMVSAQEVTVDTGLNGALSLLSQHTQQNGTALNLAINTATIDATVNIDGGENSLNNVKNKIAVETSAIGAVNTGSINLQQGNLSAVNTGTMESTLDTETSMANNLEAWHSEQSAEFESSLSTSLNTDTYDQFSETLSNYTAANLAFNSASVDASVNIDGKVNHIDGIKEMDPEI